jgi:predicted amidophosphoribosyltransferase
MTTLELARAIERFELYMRVFEVWSVLFWIACGVAARMLAITRNRSTRIWAALGLLFGPATLVVLGFLPVLGVGEEEFALFKAPQKLRKCPNCAEPIKAEAAVCRHCGRDVVTESVVKNNLAKPIPEPTARYCNECGADAPLSATACPVCLRDLPVKPIFCPKCAHDISFQPAACPGCGAKLRWKPQDG